MRASLAGPAFVLALLAAGGPCAALPQADAPGTITAASTPVRLQPHRAVYDFSLDEPGPATSIGSITGRVVYELIGSVCEGYAQNMRFVTETTNSEGQSTTADVRTSSWEDALARRMRFSTSTYGDEQLVEQTQGTATKVQGPPQTRSEQRVAGKTPAVASGLGSLSIEISKPAQKVAQISEPVFFPIDHSVNIIRSAKSGRRLFEGNLYDGSEGGKTYYFTSAAIGATQSSEALRKAAQVADAAKFDAVKSWPISIAYFKPETRHLDQLPMYEMYYRFHDNGITSDLVIDHGDYRLKGVLKELTLLDEGPCP